MAKSARDKHSIKDAALTWWYPDEGGQLVHVQERGKVWDIEIEEVNYLDAGLYDTTVIGKCYPSYCDDIPHRVEKIFGGFGPPSMTTIIEDEDAWSICGYAEDY